MALLRWFRFLGAIGLPWDQATRVEARDFSEWVQVAAKPLRPHRRHRRGDSSRWRTSGDHAGEGATLTETR
jgi:hypothetical protein